MAIYVTGLNVLLWRRLYALAETRFALHELVHGRRR